MDATDDGGVEGAAAEVVHGDGAAQGQAPGGGVGGRGGLGLGEQDDVVEADLGEGLGEHPAAVGAPAGGVGDGDAAGLGALDLGDPVGGPAHHLGGHAVRGEALAADDDRGVVAEAALELAHDALRGAGGAVLGVGADQQGPVVVDEQDRGHLDGAALEADDAHARLRGAGPGLDPDGSRGEGGAQVDAQVVGVGAHRRDGGLGGVRPLRPSLVRTRHVPSQLPRHRRPGGRLRTARGSPSRDGARR